MQLTFKVSKKSFGLNISNLMVLLVCILLVIVIPDNYSSLRNLGIAIVMVSLYTLFTFKYDGSRALMLAVILLVNFSYAYSVCFTPAEHVFYWQESIYKNSYNVIAVKNCLLFLPSLFLGMNIGNNTNAENDAVKSNIPKSDKGILMKNNSIIYTFGFLFLLYALLTGYDGSVVGSTEYVSNSNPVYEYAIVAYIFVWYYSGDNKLKKNLLLLYAAVYILQALRYGDRSAAVPMAIVILLSYLPNLKLKNCCVIGVVGMLIANVVGVFRKSGFVLTKAVVSEALNKGLFVDTISYSHYCGTTIVMLRSYLHNYLQQFFLFVYSIFVGTGRAGYNLPRLAVLTAPKLFNRGGGFTYSHFYYWFGYLGVVVFSFIMGVMIKRVYKNNDRLSKVLQLTVSAFAMRWYVYYPIAFFRSALLIPAVLYFACDIYDKLSSSQGINIK